MFEAIAASTGQTFTMAGSQGAEIVRGNRVTAEFLQVARRAARDWTELGGGRGSPGRERARRDSHSRILVGVFAGTALLVAAIGLFAVMAYLVSRAISPPGAR